MDKDQQSTMLGTVNEIIEQLGDYKGQVSDGYHTFDELYEHRITLYIALCIRMAYFGVPVWKSNVHSDGTTWEGWFLLGIDVIEGKQITYHLPISKWDLCVFAMELPQAPPFDGHTSADVLKRIAAL